jgi:hypothetical protein
MTKIFFNKSFNVNIPAKLFFVSVLMFFLVLILLGSCSSKSSLIKAPQPDKPVQPAIVNPDSLQPGLKVYYVEGFFRHVNQMPSPDKFLKKGTPGKPISKIDHRFKNGVVFDSKRRKGVGVQMMGLINLPKPGEWSFKVKSNDGIDVLIEKVQVILDPEWHADRFSEPGKIEAKIPGWYTILLRYFQRKGTATLEFYWKAPGEEDFTIIPETAYWHMK